LLLKNEKYYYIINGILVYFRLFLRKNNFENKKSNKNMKNLIFFIALTAILNELSWCDDPDRLPTKCESKQFVL
jgi:hypothetical protein